MFDTFRTGKTAIVVGTENTDDTKVLRETLNQRHAADPTAYSDVDLYTVESNGKPKLGAQVHHIIPVKTAENFTPFFEEINI